MYISSILVNTKLYISFWRISMISICIKTNNKNVISYLMENISTINLDNIFFINKQFSKYNNIIVHYIGTNIPLFLDELIMKIKLFIAYLCLITFILMILI